MLSWRSLGESCYCLKLWELIILYFVRVDLGVGEGIFVGVYFGGWLLKIVVVGVVFFEV